MQITVANPGQTYTRSAACVSASAEGQGDQPASKAAFNAGDHEAALHKDQGGSRGKTCGGSGAGRTAANTGRGHAHPHPGMWRISILFHHLHCKQSVAAMLLPEDGGRACCFWTLCACLCGIPMHSDPQVEDLLPATKLCKRPRPFEVSEDHELMLTAI